MMKSVLPWKQSVNYICSMADNIINYKEQDTKSSKPQTFQRQQKKYKRKYMEDACSSSRQNQLCSSS